MWLPGGSSAPPLEPIRLALHVADRMSHVACRMSHPARTRYCIVLPTLLATVALALSAYASLHCDFVKFVVPPATFSHEQAGLWSYLWWDHGVGRYTCHTYPKSTVIDLWWKAARAFSSLTLTLGGFASICAFAVTCCTHCRESSSSRLVTKWCTTGTFGACYLASSISASFSLLFLRSNAAQHNAIFNLVQDHECAMSTGAKCMYAAIVLWFASSSLVLLVDAKRNAEEGGDVSRETLQEPLIQDVIFECEQSTYSSRGGGGDGE